MINAIPPTRREYAMVDGTLSALHFGRVTNPLKLIFVHANGFNAQSYAQILGPLGVHAVALDMRGHGFSTLPTTPDNLPNWHVFRDDLLYFCDHYVKAPVVVAGHSFGAVSLILAAKALGPKCAGYVGFDPVIMPPLLGRLSRLKPTRSFMRKNLPIAVRAGRRRDVFDSADAAFNNYHGRGVFQHMTDEVLRDYLTGGLLPHDDGVQLACSPLWEQAIFCAQGHNTLHAIKSLPERRQIIFAGKNSPSTRSVQAKASRIIGTNNVQSDDSHDHLFPLHNPALATQALREMLQRVALNA